MEQQAELIALIKQLTDSLTSLANSDDLSQCEALLIERQKRLEELVTQLDVSPPPPKVVVDDTRALLLWVKEQDAPVVEKLNGQKIGLQKKLLQNSRASHAINKYRDNT